MLRFRMLNELGGRNPSFARTNLLNMRNPQELLLTRSPFTEWNTAFSPLPLKDLPLKSSWSSTTAAPLLSSLGGRNRLPRHEHTTARGCTFSLNIFVYETQSDHRYPCKSLGSGEIPTLCCWKQIVQETTKLCLPEKKVCWLTNKGEAEANSRR